MKVVWRVWLLEPHGLGSTICRYRNGSEGKTKRCGCI